MAKSKAKILSGGQKRRLSIAMALITRPKILFLDEPTLGLDVLARRELWQVITGLKGRITVILTTHYLEEAEALSDRIGIMSGGELKTVGTAAELISKTGAKSFEDAFISLVGGSV
jgi:ABC-2 type transport system ATP-binding protein